MPKRRGHGGGTITKRKDGRWQVAVTVGYDERGRQVRKYAYTRTKAEAERKLAELQVKYGSGDVADPGRLTVGDLLERWLDYKRVRVRQTTLYGYQNVVRKHIMPRIGHVRLAKLSAFHLESLYKAMIEAGLSPRMAELTHVVMYNALAQAVRWGMLSRNVAELADPPRGERAEVRFWTPEEVVRFLDAAKEHRLFALFYLAIVTGMRRGELLGLKWEDIDAEKGALRVRRNVTISGSRLVVNEPKTRRSKRVIYLADEALGVLADHQKRQERERFAAGKAWHDEGWIFASEVGTALWPNNLTRAFHALIDKADVPRIRFHDLRHTHVSLERRRGTPIEIVSERLGHATSAFTLTVYRHIYEEERRAALTLNDIRSEDA